MKLNNQVLTPVYLVDYSNDVHLLIPFVYEGKYGMKSVKIQPFSAEATGCTYKQRLIAGQAVLELRPELSISGDILIHDRARIPFIACTPEQVGLVIDWLSNLNKGTQTP